MKREHTRESIYWVVGAGKFGTRAVRTLLSENPGAKLVLIDSDLEKLQEWKPSVETAAADGIAYLIGRMGQGPEPDWVIPAIPVHVALELITGLLPKDVHIEPARIPSDIREKLPHSIMAEADQLWVSHADFRCPSNCPEPDEHCTITRKPRKPDMYRLLEEMAASGFDSVVVRSHQLAPGVGGYRPADIKRALSRVKRAKGLLLFSTACRCHGVVNAVRVT